MRTGTLVKRNLTYYWRTHLAVVLGVGVAVAVLAGALLVGDSVRASLRDLFLRRIGSTSYVVSSNGFFREKLAADFQSHPLWTSSFGSACPLIALQGLVTHQGSGRRASGVQIYGVDERFWRFHGRDRGNVPGERSIQVSEALERELGASPGDTFLLRVEKPSAIPAESLHGRKEDAGKTLRFSLGRVLTATEQGEFSLRPQQSAVRAVFVSLRLLQHELDQVGKVNVVLISEKQSPLASERQETGDQSQQGVALLQRLLKETYALEDIGIRLRVLEARQCLLLETQSMVLGDELTATASAVSVRLDLRVSRVFTYLANSISRDHREIPYSVVTALDPETFSQLRQLEKSPGDSLASPNPPILLNEWATHDLGVRPGDTISLTYYVWQDAGRLDMQSTRFQLAGVLFMQGAALDRDLAPVYPGFSDAANLSTWDPPFPVDLRKIRPLDEEYWHQYRTTPKAFLPLEDGQRLWGSRYGKLTSMRIFPTATASLAAALESFERELKLGLDPMRFGFAVVPVRAEGLAASRGATDFGEYFLYFSFFLVVSALLLTGLFFKLNVEQRLREVGTLQAIGFPPNTVRNLFLREGIFLAIAGSLTGVLGAWAYAGLMVFGLRTWWVGAVGTTELQLQITASSLAVGAISGIVTALAAVFWTLKSLRSSSPRELLTESVGSRQLAAGSSQIPVVSGRWPVVSERTPGVRCQVSGVSDKSPATGGQQLLARLSLFHFAMALGVAGLVLILGAWLGWVGQVAGFFLAGTLLLVTLLILQSAWLRGRHRRLLNGRGWWAVARLGFRNAGHRPARSVLCIALIASAAFIIVAVDAFRRDGSLILADRKSGSGGFALLAESLLPLIYDPNTHDGKNALNLTFQGDPPLGQVRFWRFRVRPGDDASCLNLYQPRDPRILAPTPDFVRSGRFSFQESLASTLEEKDNPWLLLGKKTADGSIPVIADANSMTYVLHRRLGDEWLLNQSESQPIRLRLVGALSDSIFQGELLMSEENFLRLFPRQEGYRFSLLDVDPEKAADVAALLEERLSDYGFDVAPTAERLAVFHRVENAYLSTFQTLGGLGLLLGTVGLGTVLLRNVLERRRELALQRAVGYNSSHLAVMVLAENLFLLCSGLATGSACALLAIMPALFSRGGIPPHLSLGLLLVAVLASGLLASLAATAAALRSPLIATLRSE